MIHLLDVNVLIALLDSDHVFHDRAHSWFDGAASTGWATCPITENAVIRILGHARYPKGPGTPAGAVELFQAIREQPRHHFWADEISLMAEPYVAPELISSSAHVTDTYLLALAVHRGGSLATFDAKLSPRAVSGGAAALALIP